METKRPSNPEAEEILGLYFPVLDNGFISLVDYMGTDQCIESAARVSYGAGTRKTSQTRGLIRYLHRHKHSTPSEMVELKFHCCMPMFIARQWIRHRTANVNEYSGRYSLMPMLFYTPNAEQFQKQSKSNNQGRSGVVDTEKHEAAVSRWNELRKQSSHLYEDLTSADIAREIARIDLPLSTYTQWYWKIDLHNLLHFLTLRVDNHAQWEIQEYGKIMAGMLKRIAPLSYEAWLEYDVGGASFGKTELSIIQSFIQVINSRSGEHELRYSPADTLTSTTMSSKMGLSNREVKELVTKLSNKTTYDFNLDLSKAKSPKYFEDKMLAAVPKIDNLKITTEEHV
jgi:thymidylate synthase (FAD)